MTPKSNSLKTESEKLKAQRYVILPCDFLKPIRHNVISVNYKLIQII